MMRQKWFLWGGLALCVMALSLTASATTDPNMIVEARRVTGVNPEPILVKGGLYAGALQFIDRPTAFGDVGVFEGLDYVRTAMDDRNTSGENTWYLITVDRPGTLFLFIDNRMGDGNAATPPDLSTKMTWVATEGFTVSGYTIPGYSEAATVYSKPVTAGSYVLYEQNDGTSRAMYGITAAPAGWEFPNIAPVVQGVPSSVQVAPGDTLTINAVVTDDGLPDPPGEVTVEWTVEEAPDGAIVTFDPDMFSTDVEIGFSEMGAYLLKFAASDSNMVTEQLVQVSVQIPQYALACTDWIEACNDSQRGPSSSYKPTQYMYIRNHSAPRRRIQFISYDISALKEEGKVFANTYLTMRRRTGHGAAVMTVYGVKEDHEMLDLSGKSWNTLPGLQNTPAPPFSEQITAATHLDLPDLSNPLLAYGPNVPAGSSWSSTQPSVGLDEFLNADTNGTVLLMFVTFTPQDADFEIFARDQGDPNPETGLGGLQIRGNIMEQTWASNPSPAVNANTTQMISQLSWTNPAGVGDITCDVYIGIGEPNYLASNYGYGTLATGLSGNSVSLNGYPIVGDTTYNWIVDVHDSGTGLTTRGYLWTFSVLNNLPPTVVVTNPVQYIWLNNDGDPESATVVFEAVGDDDGIPEPLTYLWEQVGTEPAVVAIDPNDVAAIELTLPETGTYTFSVTVSDGEISATTGAQVFVGADPCQAAQAKPGYVQNPADFNNDCYVNIEDFAFFAGQWLECNPSMDAPCVEELLPM